VRFVGHLGICQKIDGENPFFAKKTSRFAGERVEKRFVIERLLCLIGGVSIKTASSLNPVRVGVILTLPLTKAD